MFLLTRVVYTSLDKSYTCNICIAFIVHLVTCNRFLFFSHCLSLPTTST